MRVVSGKFGSRPIKTLSGDTTRPTSDKIRGAIFNKIGPYFDGGRFLDVFGGSGAMSLEALSRGMNHATILEKDRKAQLIIKENIKDFNLSKQVELLSGDSKLLIERLQGPYDLIFLDPPYHYQHTEKIVGRIIELGLVHEETIIIVETDHKHPLSEEVAGYEKYDLKEYKATQLHYFYKKG